MASVTISLTPVEMKLLDTMRPVWGSQENVIVAGIYHLARSRGVSEEFLKRVQEARDKPKAAQEFEPPVIADTEQEVKRPRRRVRVKSAVSLPESQGE